MILVVSELNLQFVPPVNVIPGEQANTNSLPLSSLINYFKYQIIDNQVIDWIYFVKNNKFYECYIFENHLYSPVELNTSDHNSLWISPNELFKRNLYARNLH
jgi:hypothetical protein